jgi:hypothetical protein
VMVQVRGKRGTISASDPERLVGAGEMEAVLNTSPRVRLFSSSGLFFSANKSDVGIGVGDDGVINGLDQLFVRFEKNAFVVALYINGDVKGAHLTMLLPSAKRQSDSNITYETRAVNGSSSFFAAQGVAPLGFVLRSIGLGSLRLEAFVLQENADPTTATSTNAQTASAAPQRSETSPITDDNGALPDWIWFAVGGGAGALVLVVIVIVVVVVVVRRRKGAKANPNRDTGVELLTPIDDGFRSAVHDPMYRSSGSLDGKFRKAYDEASGVYVAPPVTTAEDGGQFRASYGVAQDMHTQSFPESSYGPGLGIAPSVSAPSDFPESSYGPALGIAPSVSAAPSDISSAYAQAPMPLSMSMSESSGQIYHAPPSRS